MILLPEVIIELILSYAPDFRDNLKLCQKELLLKHRPIYYKKVIAGFSPGIADSPTWHNFSKKHNKIRIWRTGNYAGPGLEYMELKLHAIEITPHRAPDQQRHWHDRDINLFYGWTRLSNNNAWNTICEWNSESSHYGFSPGYY